MCVLTVTAYVIHPYLYVYMFRSFNNIHLNIEHSKRSESDGYQIMYIVYTDTGRKELFLPG